MARPVKELDQKQFIKLCKLQCTSDEIASFFDCNRDTVDAWCKRTYNEGFSAVFKKYSEAGKICLRRYQMQLAKTNTTMAIWLGKQYLGQKDRQELGFTDDAKLQIMAGYIGGIKNGETKNIGRKNSTD